MTILVTGANGLVGNAVCNQLFLTGQDYVAVGHTDCDLTNQGSVKGMFQAYKPDVVIHCAARVGGIGRNVNSPAQQFTDNILMNTNVIHEAYETGVTKFVAFGSVCAFPGATRFYREVDLHEGPPFNAHWSYAHSKRMVDVQIQAYNQQYGTKYCSIIPGNIFGEHDNFNLENGHVIPSLIRKCYEAREADVPFVVWGDGSAEREFVYSNDIARVCIELLKLDDPPERLFVSGKEVISIRELVGMICNIYEYHNVEYLTDKTNGQARRETSKSLFNKIFPDFEFIDMDIALANTISWFVNEVEYGYGVRL